MSGRSGRAGVVVLDAGCDVAEKQDRDSPLRPAPASVLVPRLIGENVDRGTVEYPLIEFPWEPWTLTSWMGLTAAQA
jgi:hypothetical protein